MGLVRGKNLERRSWLDEGKELRMSLAWMIGWRSWQKGRVKICVMGLYL